MDQVRSHFAPEFINRIGLPSYQLLPLRHHHLHPLDDIIVFNKLKRDSMASLLALRMREIEERLGKQHKIKISLTPEASEWLCEAGYNPSYGARPLNRVIKNSVLDPLSKLIIAGGIRDDETAHVHVQGGKLFVSANHAVEAGYTSDDADDD